MHKTITSQEEKTLKYESLREDGVRKECGREGCMKEKSTTTTQRETETRASNNCSCLIRSPIFFSTIICSQSQVRTNRVSESFPRMPVWTRKHRLSRCQAMFPHVCEWRRREIGTHALAIGWSLRVWLSWRRSACRRQSLKNINIYIYIYI